jgi:diguanylate cyclase (GGDEF)-like protein/PAS domain S-box-containing protein
MIAPDEIMIVDDTPSVLEFLADILIENGYKVRKITSGEMALRAVKSSPPTLILLDIRMPRMDGFEVCRQLKAHPKSHNIPVLFISRVSALDERIQGLALGAVDFITKPFQTEELLARVRTHLELNRLRTELEAQVEERTQALRQSEERYRTIIVNIADGYYEVDLRGNMVFCNPSMASILGYRPDELVGMNNRSYMSKENAKEVLLVFKKVYETGIPARASGWELIKKDGLRLFVEASISPIRDLEGRLIGMRGIVRDMTERKRMEEEMREMSLRDQLTGLYNRRGFITLSEQQIKTANRTKRPMPLVFIDVDNMKWINDTLGHEEGDRALITTAEIFRHTFRESDIMARIGGDEFAILATDATEMDPEILSGRLQETIEAYNAKDTLPYKLSMSWGAAVYDPGSPISLDELMSQADGLMYAHKKTKSKRYRL